MEKKTAHNLAIWKLIFTLQEMMDQGFSLVDLTIEDDLTLALRGIKLKELPPEEDLPDLNQLII